MGRGPKPAKGKAKPAVARKSPKGDGAKLRDLEKRLAEALRDKAEALEQQTATSEILRVISQSQTDVQPVFEVIVHSAARLLNAHSGVLTRVVEDHLVLGAFTTTDASGEATVRANYPMPLSSDTPHAQTLRNRSPLNVVDTETDTRMSGEARKTARVRGYRSQLLVPMAHNDIPVGTISLTRRDPGGFRDEEATLLKTFADQAVIAIENVRLFTELQTSNRELTTALDTQTATSDILRVISRSQTDVQPVFDTIVHSAVRLLLGYSGTLTRVAGGQIELAAFTSTGADADAALRASYPRSLESEGTLVMAIRERVPLNIATAQTDPRLPQIQRTFARVRGFQSLAAVPLLRHDEAVGAIMVTRREPGGFTDAEIALLQTFAAQAVIAIENARLLTELQARNRDLTATSEILRVISSSPTDVQPVFDAIAQSALRLCDATFCNVARYDGDLLHLAAHAHTTAEGIEAMKQLFPMRPSRATALGRAVFEAAVAHLPDLQRDAEYMQSLRAALRAKAALGVPLLRDGQPIGAIAVGRCEAHPFTRDQIALLQTFADQAVIAIENVRLFKELEVANRELEAASQHKSEFLANMSHELRTPLNAIIGFSEVLTDRMFGELNEKQEEYLKDIYSSGSHLLSLINDILDLSKIEAGRMELELTDFHLPTALDNALTLVRERAGRKSLTLQTSVDERLGEVRADERKIRQVVLNLLSNAIKFTPEGGRIEVGAVPRDGLVEVSVGDTGVGIAPEDQEAVFEEFRQVGTAEKKAEGTGLGLTLCRKFIELHGGRIWVTSHVGAGSTFTFTIPVRRDE